MHAIYHKLKQFCLCVGTCMCSYTPLLKRPEEGGLHVRASVQMLKFFNKVPSPLTTSIFFVINFIKVPVLLKTSVQTKTLFCLFILFCLNYKSIKFVTNNHLINSFHTESFFGSFSSIIKKILPISCQFFHYTFWVRVRFLFREVYHMFLGVPATPLNLKSLQIWEAPWKNMFRFNTDFRYTLKKCFSSA